MKFKNSHDDSQLYQTLPKYLSAMILANFQVLIFLMRAHHSAYHIFAFIKCSLIASKWKVSGFCMCVMG